MLILSIVLIAIFFCVAVYGLAVGLERFVDKDFDTREE